MSKKNKPFVQFTHLDKIVYPKQNVSKKQIIDYYQKISPLMLKYMHHHPIVMRRFPDGIDGEGFFQKQISDYFPSWLTTIKVSLKKGGSQTLAAPQTINDLLYLANQNCIEFHTWTSAMDSIKTPDKIVFDLDPSKDNQIEKLRQIAKILQKTLNSYNLHSFVMTTGSRGYHIVVPIIPDYTFKKVHAFAKHIAQLLSKNYPDLCVATTSKAKRNDKIFIDYLRNSYGQTSVTPYSLRANKRASIATPISWQELSKTLPHKYTLKNIFKRLSKNKDPWSFFYKKAAPLPTIKKKDLS